MKVLPKTIPHMLALPALGFLAGALAWELMVRLLLPQGVDLDLKIGPLVLDSGFLALQFWLTPGAVLGTAGGVSLFLGLK